MPWNERSMQGPVTEQPGERIKTGYTDEQSNHRCLRRRRRRMPASSRYPRRADPPVRARLRLLRVLHLRVPPGAQSPARQAISGIDLDRCDRAWSGTPHRPRCRPRLPPRRGRAGARRRHPRGRCPGHQRRSGEHGVLGEQAALWAPIMATRSSACSSSSSIAGGASSARTTRRGQIPWRTSRQSPCSTPAPPGQPKRAIANSPPSSNRRGR